MWSGSLKSDNKWDEHDMIVKRSSQGRQITSINLLNPVIQFKQLRWNVLKQLERSEQIEEEEEEEEEEYFSSGFMLWLFLI